MSNNIRSIHVFGYVVDAQWTKMLLFVAAMWPAFLIGQDF